MRLWTVHPKYLDPQGLVAVWREALLAQAVLRGQTRGYTRHPQLIRFMQQPDPCGAIAAYLQGIFNESVRRGFHFDLSKIAVSPSFDAIDEMQGQLLYEWAHLLNKLNGRSPDMYKIHKAVNIPEPHPLFTIVPGGIASWERR
jgi:hypothetical protein